MPMPPVLTVPPRTRFRLAELLMNERERVCETVIVNGLGYFHLCTKLRFDPVVLSTVYWFPLLYIG